jgi:uncharacterized protein YjeT (DUF2065 family)
MSDFIILGSSVLMAVYVLANGVFAVRFPERWLRLSWTAMRGIKPDASPDSIRINGVINIAIGIVIGVAIVYFFK